jgi:hypothetical protein
LFIQKALPRQGFEGPAVRFVASWKPFPALFLRLGTFCVLFDEIQQFPHLKTTGFPHCKTAMWGETIPTMQGL